MKSILSLRQKGRRFLVLFEQSEIIKQTPLDNMYFVYVLRSKKDLNFYVGKTKNLKERFEEHKKGRVQSTKDRRPLEVVYCEISRNKKDATHRETYLKTAWGKRYLKNRLKYDLYDI